MLIFEATRAQNLHIVCVHGMFVAKYYLLTQIINCERKIGITIESIE